MEKKEKEKEKRTGPTKEGRPVEVSGTPPPPLAKRGTVIIHPGDDEDEEEETAVGNRHSVINREDGSGDTEDDEDSDVSSLEGPMSSSSRRIPGIPNSPPRSNDENSSMPSMISSVRGGHVAAGGSLTLPKEMVGSKRSRSAEGNKLKRSSKRDAYGGRASKSRQETNNSKEMVPRKEYENLKKEHNELRQKMISQKEDYDFRIKEVVDYLKTLQKQISDYKEMNDEGFR